MSPVLLAEGKSLDDLITFVMFFFLAWTLPALVGLWLCRWGHDLWVVAFGLGLVSVVAGTCFVGWMVSEHGSAVGFYLTGGTPLLVGLGACLWAWRASKRPGPLPRPNAAADRRNERQSPI